MYSTTRIITDESGELEGMNVLSLGRQSHRRRRRRGALFEGATERTLYWTPAIGIFWRAAASAGRGGGTGCSWGRVELPWPPLVTDIVAGGGRHRRFRRRARAPRAQPGAKESAVKTAARGPPPPSLPCVVHGIGWLVAFAPPRSQGAQTRGCPGSQDLQEQARATSSCC